MGGHATAVSDLERAEHQDGAKKVLAFGYDDSTSNHVQLSVNSDGKLSADIQGKTGDATFQTARLDYPTHTLQTIDYAHHEVHAGSHFFCSVYDADVDTSAPKYIRLTSPDTTKWAHLLIKYTSTGGGVWEFFENPTLNAAGDAVTVYNNDRNSLTASTVTVFQDTTTTGTDGTKLWTDLTGDNGIGGAKYSGSGIRGEEIILKQKEDYILKFTPTADNAKIVVDFSWYEHTNKTA